MPGLGDFCENEIALSPDGQRIVSCGSDQSLRLWNTASGKCLDTLLLPTTPSCVAYCSDGTHVATGNMDSSITIWEFGSV